MSAVNRVLLSGVTTGRPDNFDPAERGVTVSYLSFQEVRKVAQVDNCV
jgi:hypothetical protein